ASSVANETITRPVRGGLPRGDRRRQGTAGAPAAGGREAFPGPPPPARLAQRDGALLGAHLRDARHDRAGDHRDVPRSLAGLCLVAACKPSHSRVLGRGRASHCPLPASLDCSVFGGYSLLFSRSRASSTAFRSSSGFDESWRISSDTSFRKQWMVLRCAT